jgi:hypothetical protein
MPKHHTKNNPIFFINSNVDSISPKGCKGFKSIKKVNKIHNLQLYMPNPPYKKRPNFFIVISVDSISLKECKGCKSIKQLNFVYPNIKYLTHNYFQLSYEFSSVSREHLAKHKIPLGFSKTESFASLGILFS